MVGIGILGFKSRRAQGSKILAGNGVLGKTKLGFQGSHGRRDKRGVENLFAWMNEISVTTDIDMATYLLVIQAAVSVIHITGLVDTMRELGCTAVKLHAVGSRRDN